METIKINEAEVGNLYSKIKFGKTLALSNIIKNLKIDQKDFAEEAGYTEVYISQIASRAIKISDKALTKICLATGNDVTVELIRSALYIRFGEKIFDKDSYTLVTYLIDDFLNTLDKKYEGSV